MKFLCSVCDCIIDADDTTMGTPVLCGNCEQPVVVPEEYIQPGAILGDFLILQQQSQNDFFTFYEGLKTDDGDDVTLSVLNQEFRDNQELCNYIISDFQNQPKIKHDSIVKAYSIYKKKDILCMVFESFKGRTIEDIRISNTAMAISTYIIAFP